LLSALFIAESYFCVNIRKKDLWSAQKSEWNNESAFSWAFSFFHSEIINLAYTVAKKIITV
jgi:hypothetical protein